ncbi:MAG: TonB-dependent receptor plug domain-containing protein [Cellvibrionaceae bacterium]
MRKRHFITSLSVLALAGSLSAPQVLAQEGAEEVLEEVVTLGSRTKPRSVTDSPAPVDVFSGDELAAQGGSDMSDLIRNVVPSFNVNDQPISDAATLVRPANLRGLAPDHTLLLVNGKRRHRAAVITWLGNGISNGSQGPDIAAIPGSAIKSVEVLRDGAAAQYGSDAIAGVMNFQLKDASDGGSVDVKYGEYSEGDGEQYTIAINKGLPLGDNGFLNLTAEYSSVEETDRSVQRADAQGLIDDGYVGVPVNAMIWGTPEVDDDIKVFANFGIQLSDAVELYGYTNYNNKTAEGGFYYRNPTDRGGVYGDGDELLIGDLTPSDGNACPTVALTGNIPDAASFAQVVADPNCFSFQETIPGGFTPRFGGEVTDTALLLGLRGEDGDLSWDVSAYYGKNEADFFINNTLNASMGPDSPRDFDPGAYEQEDMNVNVDFVYALSDQVGLAFGVEYRTEEFTIKPGEFASYTDGGLGDQGFSTSSNGFPGFAPSISGSWERKNYAAYFDVEYDVTEDLLLTSAIRFEDFDDFGTTTNFKVGANYSITENFGMRATFSTGFKAPTPGQTNASNLSTQNVNGVLVNQGTIPSTSEVALAAGGKALEPEESENFTIGTYFTVGGIDVTIDYFHIDVSDRLNLSSEKELTAAQRAQLIAEGVAGVDDIAEFRFFTNDFDTNTSGIDLVASVDTEWLDGMTTWSLAYNYTKTEVEKFNPETVDDTRVKQIEETTPDTRWNFTAVHQMDVLRFTGRISYYGDFFDNEAGGTFDDAMTLDLEMAYDLNENSIVTLGGRNITNERGCTVDSCSTSARTDLGNKYSQFSPFGFNGAHWYARYQYSF